MTSFRLLGTSFAAIVGRSDPLNHAVAMVQVRRGYPNENGKEWEVVSR